MNNPFKTAKNFISRYKKEEWFRAVAVIVIVTALAAVGFGYRQGGKRKKNNTFSQKRRNIGLKIKQSGLTTFHRILLHKMYFFLHHAFL